MKFYSHPDKLLVKHLMEVYHLNLSKVPDKLKCSYEIVALCHDFGKYTTYFQKYLMKPKNKSDLSNHGFISAIFGAYVAFNRLGEDSALPLIIYNVILHHHGNIESFSENLPNNFKGSKKTDYPIKLLHKKEIGYKQISDIYNNLPDIVEDFASLGLKKELEEFLSKEDIINKTLERLKRQEFLLSMESNKEENYFIHQSLYSALISADKISASGIKYDNPIYPDFHEISDIRKEKFNNSKKINFIRENIFQEVLKSLYDNYDKGRIFSITAPTGTGKTYTGFFAAAKLKELLGLEGKIIYSLPFTSIIEQNYDAIVDILKSTESFATNAGRYIIKHHNLSKNDYKTDYHDYSKTQSELLIENWESGIIVTTFVQLFETLIGNRNRMLKKFISFYNSVVLIDELQSVDIKYYKLIESVLTSLCEFTNCRIIIMTATKPMILENAIELLPNNKQYYKEFNRTKLTPRLEKISLSSFADEFISSIENKSYLIVCNTINQSLEVYNALKILDKDIYYLSTNILPFKRKEIIGKVKKRLENRDNIILVSTQVVEAGVDLDFDEVIRDLAPLDSIIQCAGRCNRNFSRNQGDVKVVNMVNDNGESFGKYIYGNTLLNMTRQLLMNEDQIEEIDYYNLINKYYGLVNENKSKIDSTKFIESISSLNFSGDDWSLNKFSLIQDNPSYIDVLFLYNEEAEEAYEEYKEIIKLKSFQEKREKYLEVGQVFKNYTLSIPQKYCRSFVEENGLLILPREGIDQYYDEDTGFIRNDTDTYMIF